MRDIAFDDSHSLDHLVIIAGLNHDLFGSPNNKPFYFCSVTFTARRAIAEREIKFYFIARRIIARRSIKLLIMQLYFPLTA